MPDRDNMSEREPTYADVISGEYDPYTGKWKELEKEEAMPARPERGEEAPPVEEKRVFYDGMVGDLAWATTNIPKDDPDREGKSQLRSEARARLRERGVDMSNLRKDAAVVNRAMGLVENGEERERQPEQWTEAQTVLGQVGVDVEKLVAVAQEREEKRKEAEATRVETQGSVMEEQRGSGKEVAVAAQNEYEPMTGAQIEEARKRVAPEAFVYQPQEEGQPVKLSVEEPEVLEGEFEPVGKEEKKGVYYSRILDDLARATEAYQRIKGLKEADDIQQARLHNARIDESVDNLREVGIDTERLRERGDDGRRARTRLTVAVGTVRMAIGGREVDERELNDAVEYLKQMGVDTSQLGIPIVIPVADEKETGPVPGEVGSEPIPEEEAEAKPEAAGGVPVRNRNDRRVAEDLSRFQAAYVDQPEKLLAVVRNRLSRERGLSAEMVIYLDSLQGQLMTQVEDARGSRPIDLEQAQKELDEATSPTIYPELAKRRDAARRWLNKWRTKIGITREMVDDAEKMGSMDQEKISEVEIRDGEREKIEVSFRMAMIEALEVKKLNEPPSIQSFENFRTARARDYGYGKTHFPKDFEDEMEREYNARAELARIMVYWDGSPDMEEGSLKGMPLLSRSSYEWLAKEKGSRYLVEKDGERKEKVESLRDEMNKVASEIYARMVSGEIDVWNKRGEDRLKMYAELASDPNINVSVDAVRLAWQLAEAECWQARMEVSFVSHKAGKLVVFSDYRDFQSRKAKGVPGGMRRWMEYLQKNRNIYPSTYKRSVYDAEGARLARVGFEAWSLKVGDSETDKDPRVGEFRKGQILLFSEDGRQLDIPNELYDVTVKRGSFSLRANEAEIKRIIEEFVSRRKTEVKKGKAKDALDSVAQKALGGERALLAGQYFTQMEAFLAQPAITDIDLPQTLVRGDLVKAANVMKTIEAFGEIDASKASLTGLEKLRDGLFLIHFGFQSNDIRIRRNKDGKDNVREVNVSGARKYWEIDEQAQEKSIKARIRVGELTEEWARSYVYLLSWENPALDSESKVVGIRDWVMLGRDVAMKYDSNHQWGEFIGYGCGNYNGNELAVESDGRTPRRGPTTEMKSAAGKYRKWFNDAFYRNQNIIDSGDYAFTVTKARHDKDVHEYGEYSYGFLFWKNGWWGLKADDN